MKLAAFSNELLEMIKRVVGGMCRVFFVWNVCPASSQHLILYSKYLKCAVYC